MFSSESAGDKCLILIPPTACHSELKEAIKNKLLDVARRMTKRSCPRRLPFRCARSPELLTSSSASREIKFLSRSTIVIRNALWSRKTPIPVPFDEPQTADRLGRNEVVRQLYTMVTNNLGQGFADFNQLSFCIYVPQFTSLKEQTEERVLAVPSLANCVHRSQDAARHHPRRVPLGCNEKKGSAALSSAEKFPLGGYCDRVLNDDAILGAPNVIVLCVSATPQNNLSCNSRIPSKNIVYWNKPELAYRSSASYIETAVESVNGNWTVAQKDTSLVRFDKVFKDRLESFAKIFGTNQPKTVWWN
ncbi:hypothetical protein BASA82_000285 [Batrachochytrium salamandrivorans]|nr:hypothetical protein BASA82_000285 [Batrachochytrium salamandrivorans]